ncbi:MAG: right-handed parallel beta-helix repeat-containing protein [Verrucomicrobiales bacterium]|nr:right-handed parallel beta-helix repeat-containing protein [Verrucomicrobiales bacterium]
MSPPVFHFDVHRRLRVALRLALARCAPGDRCPTMPKARKLARDSTRRGAAAGGWVSARGIAFAAATVSCAQVLSADYHVDPVGGADSNPGTAQQPWRTPRNIVSYYAEGDYPPGYVWLQPGDTVWFHDGTHVFSYEYNNRLECLQFRAKHGAEGMPITLRAFPGARPVIVSTAATSPVIKLEACSHWIIDGLEPRDGWSQAILLDTCTGIEIRHCRIEGTEGVDNSNLAGLYSQHVDGLHVHHCVFKDNYDRINDDTGGKWTANSRHIVLFNGGDARIHDCLFINTPAPTADVTGCGIGYKHKSILEGAVFEVHDNVFVQCAGYSIATGTARTHIHHNLMIDSGPVALGDQGGPTDLSDNLVEYNTFVRTGYAVAGGAGLSLSPLGERMEADTPKGPVVFRHNIVTDHRPQNFERGILVIGTYGCDDLYAAFTAPGMLTIDSNVYFHPFFTSLFNFFSSNLACGPSGGSYEFAQWQALGFDQSSIQADPQLDAAFVPEAAAAASQGRFGDVPPFRIWQHRHFDFEQLTRPDVSGADADPDDDGETNQEEFDQGTDPWLGEETPVELDIRRGVQIQWPTKSGRMYQLQGSVDLESWSDIGDPVEGDGQPAAQFLESSGVQRFYRLAPL